jgi:uncharacterized protein
VSLAHSESAGHSEFVNHAYRFFLILSVLLAYTIFKFVQVWPKRKWTATLLGVLLFIVMTSGMLFYRAHESIFNDVWFEILAWAGAIVLGFWATLLIFSLPLDIAQVLTAIFSKATGASEVDQKRRDLFFGSLHVSVFAASAGLAGLGLGEVLRGPKIEEIEIPIADLPIEFDGLKITQISDLHIGPTLRKDYVSEVVRLVNSTKPDLLLFTGDLADAHVSSVAAHMKPMAELEASLGKFYCTGNHEYYWGAEDLIGEMWSLGFAALVNENKLVSFGGKNILIAGVTDPAGEDVLVGHTPDVKKSIQNSTHSDLKILMAHRPGTSLEAEPLGFDLQFSGHTHAGQFFPFSLFIGLAHKYSRGLYKHGRMWVYVNPGTGYWGAADRLGVRAEITAVTLRRG